MALLWYHLLYILEIDGMYKQNKPQLVVVNQMVSSRLSGWFSTRINLICLYKTNYHVKFAVQNTV